MECSVALEATVTNGDPDAVFSRLADFGRYPELTTSVRAVSVNEADGDVESSWEVNFRKGLLKWTELDKIDHDARVIEFEQIRGDLAAFAGTWKVHHDGDTTTVRFDSRFDLGIESLAEIVDPIACAAMSEGMQQILCGLFGDDTPIEVIAAAPIKAT